MGLLTERVAPILESYKLIIWPSSNIMPSERLSLMVPFPPTHTPTNREGRLTSLLSNPPLKNSFGIVPAKSIVVKEYSSVAPIPPPSVPD